MGLDNPEPVEVEEDENIAGAPDFGRSDELGDHPHDDGADEVDEEESLVAVPPSPEPLPPEEAFRQHQQLIPRTAGGTDEIVAEELDGTEDGGE